MKNKKKKKRKNKKLNIIQEIKNKVFKKEEDDWNSNTFSMFEVIIIILISILFGVVVGYIITCGKTSLSVRDKNMLEIVDVVLLRHFDIYGIFWGIFMAFVIAVVHFIIEEVLIKPLIRSCEK